MHFILETNANVLVAQLNWSATDLLSLLVTRWIAYIKLFDFKVCYVLGHKHTAADGLSRRLQTELDNIDKAHKTDIEDFINAKLRALSIASIEVEEDTADNILKNKYLEDLQKIAIYLTTLCKLNSISRTEF